MALVSCSSSGVWAARHPRKPQRMKPPWSLHTWTQVQCTTMMRPSQKMFGDQGRIPAQAERQSSQLSEHDSIGALPQHSRTVWGSMGPPNGHRPSQSVPLHKQQLLQAGVIGVPNSGKSTLTNALVGSKVRCFNPAQTFGWPQTIALRRETSPLFEGSIPLSPTVGHV